MTLRRIPPPRSDTGILNINFIYNLKGVVSICGI